MNEKTSKKQENRIEEEYERPFKSKNFIEALKNATNGILYTIRTQRNIKIQIVFGMIAIIFAVLLESEVYEVIGIILSIFFILFAEMLNTAIETTIDLITKEYNIKAKIAKDIMAGAVLLTSINSIIVGCIVFIPKIWIIINSIV